MSDHNPKPSDKGPVGNLDRDDHRWSERNLYRDKPTPTGPGGRYRGPGLRYDLSSLLSYTHVYSYIHTHVRTTCIHITRIHTCPCTHVHTVYHVHTRHTYKHSQVHTYVRRATYIHVTNTHVCTCVLHVYRVCTRMHIHVYTLTHTYVPVIIYNLLFSPLPSSVL